MAQTPNYYDVNRIGTLFYPDVQTISEQAIAANLKTTENDDPTVLLLLVDMQVDFCHKQGTLHTPGALDDIQRVIEYIFKHAEHISHIASSLDSHYPLQIFHPAWWRDNQGNHPKPMTQITLDEVESGKWQPIYEKEWSLDYVKNLEDQAKKKLMIWPYHVPIGGVGHMLDPELWSAVFWHSIARREQPSWWQKGDIDKTEYYSVFQPEIDVSDEPGGDLRTDYVETIKKYDYVIVAGEAESHCVLETAEDLVTIFKGEPEQLKKIYFLRDCMSPVQHPEIDFKKIANEAFEKFEKQGIQFLTSKDDLPF